MRDVKTPRRGRASVHETSRIAVSAVAATAVIVSVTWATGHSATATESLTFEFVDSSPDAVTDGGKRGPSAGDALDFQA